MLSQNDEKLIKKAEYRLKWLKIDKNCKKSVKTEKRSTKNNKKLFKTAKNDDNSDNVRQWQNNR